MAGFDKIQLARDTKNNIETNVSKLNEYEPILATDVKKLFTKINGRIEDLTGLNSSDINSNIESDIGIPSSALTKFLNEKLGLLETSNKGKLDKGSYQGTAQDLKQALDDNIEQTNQNKSDILSRVKLYESLDFRGLSFNKNGNLYWGTEGENNVFFDGKNCISLNNFCRFANGLQMVFGTVRFLNVGNLEAQSTVTLPVSFSSDFYCVASVTNTEQVQITHFTVGIIKSNLSSIIVYLKCLLNATAPLVDVNFVLIGR